MSNTKTKPTLSFRSLYIYLVSGISLVMIVAGTIMLTNYVVNMVSGPKYRLDVWVEDRCMNMMQTGDKETKEDVVKREAEKTRCLEGVEAERSYRKTADLANALVVLIAGGVLFFTHFVYLRKRWEQ